MKPQSVSKTLGITQEELALLLGVSRSQLSMYELGKRNLSVEAKLKLSKLLEAVKINNKSKTISNLPKIAENHKSIIKNLLQLNHQKQVVTKKKLIQLQTKIEKSNIARRLANSIKPENNFKTTTLLHKIVSKKVVEKNEELLLKISIKLEVLQAEEEILKQYFSKYF